MSIVKLTLYLQWAVGVAPTLPGFIAAVNTNVQLSDGSIELYYMNYLYGFLASGLVLVVLHRVFPDRVLDQFLRESPSAKELQQLNSAKWDITASHVSDSVEEEQQVNLRIENKS